MNELREQLEILRARVAGIDAKYAAWDGASAEAARAGAGHAAVREEPPQIPDAAAQRYLEEWLNGAEVETAFGRHFETEKLYPRHRRHGSADIGELEALPHDLLEAVCGGPAANSSPAEWAFLDTETTGLSGGTGTCAFLVGVGRITAQGFCVRQFFMRDYAEEASLLDALTRHLAPFRVLITYNGRTFDQPLLETRYRMNRARPPFARMEHLDLLHGARRLWKLRFESCRLVDLESQILGVDRQGDVPGALIPYLYFEYLRTQRAARMLPVFQHNATDILTLACLTAIVPVAFKDPCGSLNLRHGAEMAGVARWLRQAGDLEQARTLFRRAIETNIKDELLFRTLWDLAQVEHKLDAVEAAVAVWTDLAAERNPYRVRALEQLAKHWEHRVKDPAKALEATRAALAFEDSAELRRREARLVAKLTPGKAARVKSKSRGGRADGRPSL
jgi:uncharacterized protein